MSIKNILCVWKLHRTLGLVFSISTLFFAFASFNSVQADSFEDQRQETKDFALKGFELYNELGHEKAMEEFMANRDIWYLGKEGYYLHITISENDKEGHKLLVDTGFTQLIGMNVNELADLDGRNIGTAMLAINENPDEPVIIKNMRFITPETNDTSNAEAYCVLTKEKSHIFCAWSQKEFGG